MPHLGPPKYGAELQYYERAEIYTKLFAPAPWNSNINTHMYICLLSCGLTQDSQHIPFITGGGSARNNGSIIDTKPHYKTKMMTKWTKDQTYFYSRRVSKGHQHERFLTPGHANTNREPVARAVLYMPGILWWHWPGNLCVWYMSLEKKFSFWNIRSSSKNFWELTISG